jgi:uncharacterized membrane protein
MLKKDEEKQSGLWNMVLAFIMITSTSVILGETLKADPLIIAGAFLGFYKGSEFLKKGITLLEEQNRIKEEEAKKREE